MEGNSSFGFFGLFLIGCFCRKPQWNNAGGLSAQSWRNGRHLCRAIATGIRAFRALISFHLNLSRIGAWGH